MLQVAALVKQAQAIIAQAEAIANEHGIYVDIGELVRYDGDVEDAWRGSNC